MKNLIKHLLIYLNLFFAFLLVTSYLSYHVNPEKAWFLQFLGLAYPSLVMINIAFLLLWLFRKKKYIFLPIIAIALGWNHLETYIQINLKNNDPYPAKTLKVLSYNVRIFNYYDWVNDDKADMHIFEYIKAENPDVLCLQEYFASTGKLKQSDIERELAALPYKHVHFTSVSNNTGYGIATYSRYPIVNEGFINFKDTRNITIYTDIKIMDDTIRVYNNHLQSIRFLKRDYDFIDTLQFRYNEEHIRSLRNISAKMKTAYIKRSSQAETISKHIKSAPHPVISCGDFNDTPVSYTYRKMKGNLIDSFVAAGNGVGNTYIGKVPSFRIDYILHSPELTSLDFQRDKIVLSDHYPISATISY